MLTFFAALCGFLLARCLWDSIKRWAAACEQSPLAWMLSTGWLLFKFAAICSIPLLILGLCIVYVVTRR